MSHYLTLLGYEHRTQSLFFADTWLGMGNANLGEAYGEAQFGAMWQNFNRGYIVIYPKAQQTVLNTLLRKSTDFMASVHLGLEVAETEITEQPNNPFTWLNLCQSEAYLADYDNAARACDKAFASDGLPTRLLWYSTTPLEVYYVTKQYDRVVALATSAILTTPQIEEVFYWRGMAYHAQGKYTAALQDFKAALTANPKNIPAKLQLNALLERTMEF
jgi:tetratricopeptide (TPR) repeat protein